MAHVLLSGLVGRYPAGRLTVQASRDGSMQRAVWSSGEIDEARDQPGNLHDGSSAAAVGTNHHETGTVGSLLPEHEPETARRSARTPHF